MKKYGIVAAAAGILTVSAASWALSLSTNPVLITSVEVDRGSGPHDSGDTATNSSTYLSFSATPNTRPSGCTSTSQDVIYGSADNVRNMTSIATAAMLAGKKVTVGYASGCFSANGFTFPAILDLNVAQ